ncbi:MAG: UvrD-helicase domain-containing protein [Tessaracoccus sp.]|uniref:UvrD-helicase domain-containing protein n=1 Tax=Tessaracoccus sp. TaxID=1971211 RepID=UPI001EC2F8A9|nr:UvrD-helicase domain-containing protein [Tessaracoccus sp.]MBK7823279.1 UvrD-helicase domain-containing protein [Tessaracoccus sp.]
MNIIGSLTVGGILVEAISTDEGVSFRVGGMDNPSEPCNSKKCVKETIASVSRAIRERERELAKPQPEVVSYASVVEDPASRPEEITALAVTMKESRMSNAEAWNEPPRVDLAGPLRIESGIIGTVFTMVLSYVGTGEVLGRYEAQTDEDVEAIFTVIQEIVKEGSESPALSPVVAPAPVPPRSPYADPEASIQERAEWVKSGGHLAWTWNEPERQWYEIGTHGGKGVDAYAAPASNVVDGTTGVRSYRLFNGSESARDWLRGVWGYMGTLPSQKPASAISAISWIPPRTLTAAERLNLQMSGLAEASLQAPGTEEGLATGWIGRSNPKILEMIQRIDAEPRVAAPPPSPSPATVRGAFVVVEERPQKKPSRPTTNEALHGFDLPRKSATLSKRSPAEGVIEFEVRVRVDERDPVSSQDGERLVNDALDRGDETLRVTKGVYFNNDIRRATCETSLFTGDCIWTGTLRGKMDENHLADSNAVNYRHFLDATTEAEAAMFESLESKQIDVVQSWIVQMQTPWGKELHAMIQAKKEADEARVKAEKAAKKNAPPASPLPPLPVPTSEATVDQALYARIEAAMVAQGLPPQGKALAFAIQTGKYSSILDTRNKTSRKVFTAITGVKLPPTIKGTQALFVGKPFPVLSDGSKPASKPEAKPVALPPAPDASNPYSNTRRYGARRPAAYGAIPAGSMKTEADDSGRFRDLVTYPQPLPLKELAKYELSPIFDTPADAVDSLVSAYKIAKPEWDLPAMFARKAALVERRGFADDPDSEVAARIFEEVIQEAAETIQPALSIHKPLGQYKPWDLVSAVRARRWSEPVAAPAATEDGYEDLPPMSLNVGALQPLHAPNIASSLLSGVDVEAEIAAIPDPPEKTEAQAPVGAILMPAATAAQSADPAVASAARKWSPYQSAIFDEVRTGQGHVVIEAVAGSGKTTTILEAIKQINTDKKVLMVAFNKTIQKELQARLPRDRSNIAVSTLAAHGYSILRRYWKARYISTKGRGEKLLSNARDEEVFAFAVREYIGNDANADQVRADVKDLMGLCESFLAMDDNAIRSVQEDYELLLGSDGAAASWYFDGWNKGAKRRFTHADILRWVKAGLTHRMDEPPANSNYAKRMVSDRDTGLYNEMTEDGKLGFVSFRDMSFVVSATKSMVPETLYDVIFVDETQDMDVAQIELVFRSLAPQGRIVVVGDRNQSIYRFRGADSEVIPRLIKELSATVLPLSVSYRVPGCAAEEARKLVPEFSVPETTPDGKPWPMGWCGAVKAKEMVKDWSVGDIVITRINKPLVPMGMLALGSGISPWILGEGNAIANQIKFIMYKIRRKSIGDSSLQAFIDGAEKWLKEEQGEVRKEVLSRIARWEANEKKAGRPGKWRTDKELTVQEDGDYIEKQLIFNAFWNESKTGLAQKPTVKTADDIEEILKSIAPSEKAVEAMTPEEYKQMLSERLVLTSVHRIKGGEANRVFLLADTFKYGRNGWQKRIPPNEKDQKEEMNLWYVAVTRAKNELDKPGRLSYVEGVDQLLGRGWDKGSG